MNDADLVTRKALKAFGTVLHTYGESTYLKSADYEAKADKSEIDNMIRSATGLSIINGKLCIRHKKG